MSKEKQSEEMAKITAKTIGKMECKTCEDCKWNGSGSKDADCTDYACAEALYNAGYRKQSEGEWQIKSEIYKLIDDVDEELYVECPFCKRRFPVPYEFDDEKIFKYAREHYPYCNCGAKMKGGAE